MDHIKTLHGTHVNQPFGASLRSKIQSSIQAVEFRPKAKGHAAIGGIPSVISEPLFPIFESCPILRKED